MKSITFIAAGLLGGGIEKAYSSLANHLVNNGYDISVVLLFKTEHFFTLDPKIQLVEPTYQRKGVNKYYYALKTIPYLRKNIKRFKPDVILSYGEWFNPFVILSTRGLKIPVYVSDRMSPTLKLGKLQDGAKKIFYRMSNGVLAQTTYAKDIITKRTGQKNIKVIPNPVNVIETTNAVKKDQIVTVGRLSREKGHIYLIKAFAILKNKDWTLHIVGDGKERSKLEEEVKRLNIVSRVVFHGHKKDFTQILSESKVFVLPSLSEGFPNALIEAMSVPLPCISSNCIAGPSDIIQEGINGLLIPPGNVEELALAIDILIKNKDLRKEICQEALKVREELHFDKIAIKVTDFIFEKIK